MGVRLNSRITDSGIDPSNMKLAIEHMNRRTKGSPENLKALVCMGAYACLLRIVKFLQTFDPIRTHTVLTETMANPTI